MDGRSGLEVTSPNILGGLREAAHPWRAEALNPNSCLSDTPSHPKLPSFDGPFADFPKFPYNWSHVSGGEEMDYYYSG